MLGYGYCAMYRGTPITDEVNKAEFEERKKIIDFATRKPIYK